MNLPNKLSVFRIVLVPVLVAVYLLPQDITGLEAVFYFNQYAVITYKDLIALVIFAVASFTDFLDGYLARKHNLVTSFGKFIDPIADKLLVNTSFLMLAFVGKVPMVAVVIMIWRDMIVDGIRMMAAKSGTVMAAGMLGKIKTVTQMFAIIFCFLNNLPFAMIHIPVDQILVWSACVVSVLSGISYFMQAKDILMESM